MNPGGTSIAPLAVSPDGRYIAFLARPIEGNQPTMMWIRARESLELQMLAGTAGAASPFWSPDNRHLGFFVAGALKSIDVVGGLPVTFVKRVFGDTDPLTQRLELGRIVPGANQAG